MAEQALAMSADEISQLAINVIMGYEQRGYVAKPRGLSAGEIRQQVIQTGMIAPEDEDERVVLEEVVRLLCERFGRDTKGEDDGTGRERGPSKGEGKQKSGVEGKIQTTGGPLGNTSVMVAPGQLASEAVYEQWKKVKEQVKEWEKEGVRMKAYDVNVEDGVVKKRLKSEDEGLLMLRRANAARANNEDEASPENGGRIEDDTGLS